MKRLAIALLAAPLGAGAQQAGKFLRIDVLSGESPERSPTACALREGLHEVGDVDWTRDDIARLLTLLERIAAALEGRSGAPALGGSAVLPRSVGPDAGRCGRTGNWGTEGSGRMQVKCHEWGHTR